MKRLLVIAALVATALPAAAGPREDTMSGIARCSLIADDRTYLDCIYGAAQPLRARLGLPPAPAAQQRLVPPAGGYAPAPAPVYAAPPVASAPRATMAPPAKQVGAIDSLLGNDPTAGWIEVFSFDSHGLFTVTFSNGQIWKQNGGDTARAHWNGRASDYSIKLAIDGSGKNGELMVRGDAGTYRLHRIR